MGIHDQSVWLLAHLRGFITVRGLQVFGHHATPGYFLFVPFYWLGGGPHLLNITQVCVAALGAVPVFLLAAVPDRRARGSAPRSAIAFLLHPALQFFMSELFHPEVLAITPLLCAVLLLGAEALGLVRVLRGARGLLEGRRRARGGDPRARDRAARRPPGRAHHRGARRWRGSSCGSSRSSRS